MIKAAGGLSEVFTLPIIVIAPATSCAAMGAIGGRIWASAVARAHVDSRHDTGR